MPSSSREAERFSDPLDEAAQLASQLTDSAIAAARAAATPESDPDFDGETCVECGDDIPPARLALGRIRCVSCQGLLEKRSKLLGARPTPSGWPTE